MNTQLNKIINFSIIIASVFFSTAIYAQVELKLTCNMDIKKTYSSGREEIIRIKPILEVFQLGSHVSIIPDTNELASVSMRTGNGRIVENYSDANKWSIFNKIERNGTTSETSITIDRNTGRIVYSHDYKDGAITVYGEGVCEKVDLSKRKF